MLNSAPSKAPEPPQRPSLGERIKIAWACPTCRLYRRCALVTMVLYALAVHFL